MDFNQYLLALRARRKTFLMVLAATVLTAILVALIVPKRYDATATVLIDARDEQTMSPARLTPRERAGYIHTQVDLLLSGKVASRVVRDLKLAQQPGVREAWQSDTGGVGTIEDWIGASLLEKVKIDSGASNILIIKYSSSDPKKAADVANAFAKAYIDVSLQMRTDPGREAADWFGEQVKGLRTQVSQAQSKLNSWQKQNGITGAEERMDIEYSRMAEISTQLNAARNATYDATTRWNEAKDAVAAGNGAELPEVLSNGYVTAIKGDLQRAEARLDEQGQVFGPNHPTYQRTALEVKGLKDRLAMETKKVIGSLGQAAQQSRKREDELKNALKDQQDRIVKMRDARVEMAVMSRDVESAQRAYDAAVARQIAIKVESAARQTNLALLTPALEPARPSQPRVGLIGILSLVVGAMLAAGVVYLMEMLDRRVRSRGDLESRLAVPSLGGLSRWTPMNARLLPAPQYSSSGGNAARALPHPW